MSTGGEPPILEIRGVTKSFGDAQVLKGVSMSLSQGEFVGLVGPNGAGKSTLIKIISGIHKADSGAIIVGGRPASSPEGRAQIGTIHQDLGLVDTLSVLDNLRIGASPLRLLGPFLNRHKEQEWAHSALARVGMGSTRVTTPVGALSPGEKAMLATARLLAHGARLIIIDETTSTMSPGDAHWLLDHLRSVVAKDSAVLMVSHKVGEITSVADRVVTLVDGNIVSDEPVRDGAIDSQALVANFSLDSEGHPATNLEGPGDEEPVLELVEATTSAVGPIDLRLHAGQVVGLTGVAGSGLHDVAFLAAGVIRPRRGRVVRGSGLRMALVPPQRETQSTFPEYSMTWNMTLGSLRQFRRRGLLSLVREQKGVRDMISRIQVTPPHPGLPIKSFSGGNQQKVLFARALLKQPDLYVLCEPTRGVDVATRSEIYRLIGELKASGAAILVTTSDYEDLAAVCDLIGTVEGGRVSEPMPMSRMSDDELAGLM